MQNIDFIDKSKSILAKNFNWLFLFILITDFSILLNLPILRQCFGSIFLTIIPGFVILIILRLDKICLVEKIILSVTISLSYLLVFGLIMNEAAVAFGINNPLSTNLLTINLNLTYLILLRIARARNKWVFSFDRSGFSLNFREKAYLIIPLILPSMSIFGAYTMNYTNNNNLTLLMLYIIISYTILIILFPVNFPPRIFPLTLYSYGLSLLLMWALRSNYIVFGADTDWEYYLYHLTLANQHWQVYTNHLLDACLSISILPTIYGVILDGNNYYIYRLIYPLLFSIIPLIVYQIHVKYVGNYYAFVSSFLFISFYNFFNTNDRIDIALLFFSAFLMVFLHAEIHKVNKVFLLLLFLCSITLSHYSTTYITFFMLAFIWLVTRIIHFFHEGRVNAFISENTDISKIIYKFRFLNHFSLIDHHNDSDVKIDVNLNILIAFFSIFFLWYSYAVDVPFRSGVSFIYKTLIGFHDLFVLESGSSVVQIAAGRSQYGGIPGRIELLLSWLIVFLITLGLVITIVNRFSKYKINSPNMILRISHLFDFDYLIISIFGFGILVSSVLLPYVSFTYDITRIYFQLLILMSIFFVIGCIVTQEFILRIIASIEENTYILKKSKINFYNFHKGIKLKTSWILLIVLIPYFMCTTGPMYQLFDIPRSMSLNSEGNQYDDIFIHDEESYSAQWLSVFSDSNRKTVIYTDFLGRFRVIIQGSITPYLSSVDNSKLIKSPEDVNGYIYLRYFNIVNKKILVPPFKREDIAKYIIKFSSKNKIYGNGGSSILL